MSDVGDVWEKVIGSTTIRPNRLLLWARLLGVTTHEARWEEELAASRSRYTELKALHRKESDVRKFDPQFCNPLARNADNPFQKIQANEQLMQEIWKDVERTYPEEELFQSNKSRHCMQTILFHWCKACNPGKAAESYRQGMNELVAVCYFVTVRGTNELCGEEHNEADAFSLFSALMESGLRDMFAIVLEKKGGPDIGQKALSRAPAARPQSAVLARCDHIFGTILAKVDSQLHRHLRDNSIEPQLFMLRWLRLLFCREFPLTETIALWTSILSDSQLADGQPLLYVNKTGPGTEGIAVAQAASKALPLVDYMAVALMTSQRHKLLGSDEINCLQSLMKYSPSESIQQLVSRAKQLRSAPRTSQTQQPPAKLPSAAPLPVQKVTTSPVQRPSYDHVDLFGEDELTNGKPDHQTQVQQLSRRVTQLEQEKVALAAKAKQFVASKTDELKSKIVDLEARLSEATARQADGDHSESFRDMEAQLAQAKAVPAQLNRQVQQLSGQIEELEAAVANAQAAKASAESVAQDALQKVAVATQEVSVLTSKNQELENHVANQAEEIKELKRKILESAVTAPVSYAELEASEL